MKELFADTGVQILSYHVSRSGFEVEQIGHGWQICRVLQGTRARTLSWLQWRVEDGPPRFFLAVDTTLGPENRGYFADRNTFSEERREFNLAGLLDASDQKPLDLGSLLDEEDRQIPGPPDFAIRARGDGDPREVHLAVDFGNNRTGAPFCSSRSAGVAGTSS